MASLKQLAVCIGLPQSFSVVGHFFGYASPPPWNLAASQGSLPQSLSLLTHMKRLQQTHFHLNLIRVGASSFDGLLNAVDEQNLDCAVQITRDIYAAVGIGIGRVERWWMIQETSYETIDDDCEAEDLVDEYTVPNNGVDCFFVQMWVGTVAGLTPSGGDGVVVESRENTYLGTARTMAHELGHFFGLDTGGTDGVGHQNNTPSNLMCQSKSAKTMPSGEVAIPGSTQLNSNQIATIKAHDAMKGAC